jgi:tRNA (cmo5U34)-methyltransferase
MNTDYSHKSTNEEIRSRFDQDVERFSNLETGQANMIDAALTMELCTEAAKYTKPDSKELLDIGCGAGNYTLKMLSKIPGLNCTLNDLSMPMLKRAKERVAEQTSGTITIAHDDMRNLNLADSHFDIVLAAATFHHLRDNDDWEFVFHKVYKALKPGGSLWISDIVTHDAPSINLLFSEQFSEHLEKIGGAEYRKKVLDYVDHEDSPRSLNFQLELLKKVGFKYVETLHKNGNVAAFGGVK